MATSVRSRRRPGEPTTSTALPEALSLAIHYRPIADLKPAERQARKHSRKQLQQIANSIREFGFVSPILVDAEGRIVAGHGRAEAAKSLKLCEVPTVCLAHLSDTESR